MFIYFLLLPFLYVPIKLVLCLIVAKFGKFSYDGFSAVGFSYDAPKDLFYTTRNAWQRKFGYCYLYDLGAPIFRMIIDTEPVRFSYNNKNWLITFWKGQYGMTTGGEVGVYYTNQKMIDKKTLYFPATDKELLDMSIDLYKNGELIASASDKHWWLAIFKMGMFSRPKDLRMDVKITFPDKEMFSSFLKSFVKLGYKYKDYKVEGNTFSFSFKKPHTRKVWTRSWILDGIRQHYNKKNVMLYDRYLADLFDDNLIDDYVTPTGDKLIMLESVVPDILKNKSVEIKELDLNEVSENDRQDVPADVLKELNEEIAYLPYTPMEEKIEEQFKYLKEKKKDDLYINDNVYTPGVKNE